MMARARFLVKNCTATKNQYPTQLIHPEKNKNDAFSLKKKTTTPASQGNCSHHQNIAITPSCLPTPEISSSSTQFNINTVTYQHQKHPLPLTHSISTPITNQQQEQYQELKNRIIALESRVEFLET